MPRKCLVCSHEQREAIDRALVAGETLAAIAALYCVSKDSVGRHKAKHLPATLVKAEEASEITKADELLQQVRDLQERALAILGKAEAQHDLKTALRAIREARGNLELLAKILGEIESRPTFNITVSAEWLSLRAVIIETLESHPDAQAALVKRLARIEGNGGK